MQEFDYQAVERIEQAVALLGEHGDKARVLNGGTDLVVQLREGRRREVGLLVDVKAIPELNELVFTPDGGLRIGAAVTCARFCSDARVRAQFPGLVDGASLIGGTQIQGRATLGGNLSNASPAADSIPGLIAHGALCVIAGPGGRRELPAAQFCTAPGRTALGRGELLVSLLIPALPPRSGAAYLRFTPRNEMDIAVVGAGALAALDESGQAFQAACLALGAVGPTPIEVSAVADALRGQPVNEETLALVARLAREAARPISDMRGTAEQRRHLSGVLSVRALRKAIERARDGRKEQ